MPDPFRPQLAQGAAFAAKARQRAGNLTDYTGPRHKRLFADSRAAWMPRRLMRRTLENLPADSDVPAYEIWRRRIQNHFAQSRPAPENLNEKHNLLRFAAPLVAIAIIVRLLLAWRGIPASRAGDCAKLAAQFKFEKLPLPEVPNHPPYKYIRAVHPSLSRISAWVCSLGAAGAMEDLDGDGLPNDLIYSDPRTGLVTVAPVPGTGNRYAPFTLNPAPLPYDAATMAPMGIVPGDFNEDGLMDVLVYYWGRSPVIFLRKKTAGVEPGKPAAISAADYEPVELTDERRTVVLQRRGDG